MAEVCTFHANTMSSPEIFVDILRGPIKIPPVMRIVVTIVFFALLPFGLFAETLPSFSANIVSFGATPDDGIDDSFAIQAAFNYVASRGGGKVFIPAGKWNVTQNLWIGDNTDVEGEGYA